MSLACLSRHRLVSCVARALLACSLAGVAAAEPLNVLVDIAPPFVVDNKGEASGPYVEAFKQLAAARALPVKVVAMPGRRALLHAQQNANTCVLALNYAPATAEVLLYLGRVAPMYVWAFGRHDAALPVTGLADLKRYQVGSIDIAEVREVLDDAAVRYEALAQPARGLTMLAAKRFDVLIGDIGQELAAEQQGLRIDRLFTVARVERWLACHPGTAPATLAGLRQALREGLFAEAVRPVWARYGLDGYFLQVRKEWRLKP
ncbi:hypothetical protein [Chitinimonas sp.]|uniref:hypothetical protein n=1 Tax=Chitinimonas sp. TaxID=1934313 RepID=UPI0035B280A5